MRATPRSTCRRGRSRSLCNNVRHRHHSSCRRIFCGSLVKLIYLLAANGNTIAAFWYQDYAPWPEAAVGQGPSLVWKNLAEPPSLGDHWRASFHHVGTPGQPSTVPGDSNGDGRFDHRDIEFAFATGEYKDGQSMNSTWVGGVWNGVNEFTSEDFVYVFQFGHDQVG